MVLLTPGAVEWSVILDGGWAHIQEDGDVNVDSVSVLKLSGVRDTMA